MQASESERLLALRNYEILDTPPEAVFDDLVRAATRTLRAPIAVISLVDEQRQWFKACVGLDVCETSREVAFCDHAIRQDAVLVVPDAEQDDRFRDNPLVTGAPAIRFYAGAPLKTPDGARIGTLCVIDFQARHDFDDHCVGIIEALAKAVMSAMTMRIELRRQRLAESRLIASEEAARLLSDELRQVIDTVVDGVLIIGEDGRIAAVNPACEKMFGYSGGTLKGRSASMLIPVTFEHEFARMQLAPPPPGAEKDGPAGREVMARRSDGTEFPIEFSVGAMRKSAVSGYVTVVRDITERKVIDRMKSELISTISHELRTPLTSIKGSIGLIRSGVTGIIPTESSRMLDIAHNNCNRLIRIINDILDIEKISAGMMAINSESVNLASLLTESVTDGKAYADQLNITLVVAEVDSRSVVYADRDRLMQVLANLISNAVKFSNPGGRVEISLDRGDLGYRVSVTDHGPGIPAEFRDRVFSRFAQADASDTRRKGGTGLGLSIAKSIIEQHGGALGFETEAGRGTTFHFEIPDGRGDDGSAAAVRPAHAVMSRRTLKSANITPPVDRAQPVRSL